MTALRLRLLQHMRKVAVAILLGPKDASGVFRLWSWRNSDYDILLVLLE
jgi:hypothetical protein